MRKHRFKIITRLACFALISALLFTLLGAFLKPYWYAATFEGFYDQPKNSIETVFLGASVVKDGVSPSLLYEQYGISAFNLATARQTVFDSYCWAQEAHRRNPAALKTVFLEASSLRAHMDDKFGLTLRSMKMSPLKLRAFWEFAGGDLSDFFSKLSNFVSYHDRWDEIEAEDFEKLHTDANTGGRGYYFNRAFYRAGKSPHANPTVLDSEAAPAALNEISMDYFERLAAFCKEKGLKLILFKTPCNNWSPALHNAIQQVADRHRLDFMDFNYAPYFNELNFIHGFDQADSSHLNYYGAHKLTMRLGHYLSTRYHATDFRGKEGFAHLERELRQYQQRYQLPSALWSADTIVTFLEQAMRENATILIAVQDEGSRRLLPQQRHALKKMGLPLLADLELNDSYLAVIENGVVVYEQRQAAKESDQPLVYRGTLPGGKRYIAKSGGYYSGNLSSLRIDGEEHSPARQGINLAVYHNELETVVHSDFFETYKYANRLRYSLPLSERFFENTEGTFASYSPLSKMQQWYRAAQEANAALSQ